MKRLCKICVFWRSYLWFLILMLWIVVVVYTRFAYGFPFSLIFKGDDVVLCQAILIVVPVLISFVIGKVMYEALKGLSRVPFQELNKNDIGEVVYLLITLEEKIGLHNITRYRSRRPILIFAMLLKNLTVRRLARWMGLTNSNIHFSILDMDKGIGGKACLSDDSITINSAMTKHPNSFLSTLCHELAHVLLRQIRVHAVVDNDEELLTDMTCIFLGLGDVMLNGCVSSLKEEEYMGWNKYKFITETVNVGYLSPLKLAIAELIVLNMYKGMKHVSKTYSFSARHLINKAKCQMIDMGMSISKPEGLSCFDYLKLLQERLQTLT